MRITNLSLLVLLFLFPVQGCDRSVIRGSKDAKTIKKSESLTVQGSLTVKEISVRDLTVQGSTKIGPDKSAVEGDLLVQGKLEAQNLTVSGNSTVQGSAILKDCTFEKNLEIFGSGNISRSTIDGDLLVAAKKVVLGSNTTIKGKIHFTGTPGVVSIEGTDIHIEGGIVNGRAQKLNDQEKSTPLHF